ncbi:MAG: LptF/LptG family permease [Chitinophagales bacterium]
MKKLDFLLLKSYIGPLLLTFFITLFVFDMQFLWKYIDDLIGKGLDTVVLLELMFYASATMVPMALPLAVLLASIMTFGSFGEHFELTAIKSSGISLFRFMRPLIVFSLCLALAAFYFSNNILPVSNLKFRTLLYDIRHQKPALDFKPGFFNDAIDGFSIRIEAKSEDEKTIYGVLIYDHSKGADNKHVIIADSAKFLDKNQGKELVIVLYNGYDYKEEAALNANANNDDSHFKTKFQQWEKHFDLSEFQLQNTDDDMFSKMHGMLNIKQIFNELDTVKLKEEKERKLLARNLANYFINEKEKRDTSEMFVVDSLTNNFIEKTEEEYKFFIKRNLADTSTKEIYDTLLVRNFKEDYLQKNTEEKKAILANAANAARNIKNILMSKKEVLKSKKKDKGKYWIEIHRKFTLAVACIVLFFIGAPLGSIVKKGGLGWPMVMAVLFFVLYHLFTIVGEKSAVKGVIEIWQGMWLSTMILLPIGVFLTVKAKNDSKLFNGDKIINLINEIKKKNKNEK